MTAVCKKMACENSSTNCSIEVVVCRERPGLPPDRLRPAGWGGPDEAAGLRLLRRYGPTLHLISRFAIFGRPFLQ